jgi:hypothetical protein
MATIEETTTAGRLGSRLRDGLALAQTRIHTIEEQAKSQWETIPMQARAALERMLTRLRMTLDLPSRSELIGLVERIDELDRKLELLEHRQRRAIQPAADPVPAADPGLEAAADEGAVTAGEADAAVEAAGLEDEGTEPEARAQKKNGARTKKASHTSAGKTLKRRDQKPSGRNKG